MAANKSICFQMLPFMFDRRHTRLGSISKQKNDLLLCTLFARRYGVNNYHIHVSSHHNVMNTINT